MKALHALPKTFSSTREALHRAAEEIVGPARQPHNEIALRQPPGGFGTPEFEVDGATSQVRVDRAELAVSRNGEERRGVIESLAGAGELGGPELLPDGVPTDSTPLAIDPEAAEQLGDFYELAAAVLEKF